jgi:hypothetical protein
MNIVCQPSDLLRYMQTVISTFRGRMPQVTDEQVKLIEQAILYHQEIINGKKPKIKLMQPFNDMSLNELFSLVVRCADCGHTLTQALAARIHDGIHY